MSTIAKIIQIGNSKGIRIPKPIIEQIGIFDEVELVIENDELIIRPLLKPRQGWEQAFSLQAKSPDASSYDWEVPYIENDWDEAEWTW